MANEKIVNRENLKAFRQAYDERLKNGSLVPSKSLQAQSIQALSVESGAIQETPFVYQGTGTANGTDIVDTSPVGKHLEKQGNTVVVNQLVQNGNFANTSNWTANNSTFSVSNNIATITPTQQNGRISQNVAYVAGHKYLCSCFIKTTTATTDVRLRVNDGSTTGLKNVISSTDWQFVFFIYEPTQTTNVGVIEIRDVRTSDWDDIQVKDVKLIDLTKWFNGDIPQDLLYNPSNFYRYYNGSLAYNTGSLVNSDGQYLECGQGRNVWDEQLEVGAITSDGSIDTSLTSRRTTSFIDVIPNIQYYLFGSGLLQGRYAYYDKDENLITYSSQGFGASENVITIPSNAKYLKITLNSSYGTTYNHDITISLYYETGDGYDQYYPYVEPKVYDTGSEQLLAFDTKDPDGTIHRNTANVADLSSLTWNYSSTYNAWYCDDITNYKSNANFISNKYVKLDYSSFFNSSTNIGMYINTSLNRLWVRNGSDSVSPSGGLQYELDTPTTEQGTPFSENIEINDYSYMAWKNDSDYVDVPQGCKIFYPADYVLFVDSVGQRPDINWDATKLVSQEQRTSDKTTQATLDTALQNAIGGTLRNCLAIQESGLDFEDTDFADLGSLSWSTYSSGTNVLRTATISNAKNGVSGSVPKLLSTKYGVGTSATISSLSSTLANKTLSLVKDSNILAVRDDELTDTANLKGILLAYEKAS